MRRFLKVSFDVFGSVRPGYALTKTQEVKIDEPLQHSVSALPALPAILSASTPLQSMTLAGVSQDASIPSSVSSNRFTPTGTQALSPADFLKAVVFGMRGAEYMLVCREWSLTPTPDGATLTVSMYHKAKNNESRRPRFDPVSTTPLTVKVPSSLLADSKGNVASSIYQSVSASKSGYPQHVLILRVNGRQQANFFQPAEAQLGINLTRKFSI